MKRIIVRYALGVFLELLRKIPKPSVRISGLRADIYIRDLLNTK
jgi:hypothetical protein